MIAILAFGFLLTGTLLAVHAADGWYTFGAVVLGMPVVIIALGIFFYFYMLIVGEPPK